MAFSEIPDSRRVSDETIAKAKAGNGYAASFVVDELLYLRSHVAELRTALVRIVENARDQGRDNCMVDLVDEQLIEEARALLEKTR